MLEAQTGIDIRKLTPRRLWVLVVPKANPSLVFSREGESQHAGMRSSSATLGLLTCIAVAHGAPRIRSEQALIEVRQAVCRFDEVSTTQDVFRVTACAAPGARSLGSAPRGQLWRELEQYAGLLYRGFQPIIPIYTFTHPNNMETRAYYRHYTFTHPNNKETLAYYRQLQHRNMGTRAHSR
ncbi:unnamed protein product [Parascedosporium putredinis]|uniref:Uncharacterized protein n=1 Tax=Parascedosporium putredinis TaxID=1442378 RepID=A0A9P1MB57_9PEZI|nr:unnamed protein product [Parascedosporium putredinis]CAI7993992.1 unnamed protein product [Parascedosporium putredinis]